jgi:hypothetical protein
MAPSPTPGEFCLPEVDNLGKKLPDEELVNSIFKGKHNCEEFMQQDFMRISLPE